MDSRQLRHTGHSHEFEVHEGGALARTVACGTPLSNFTGTNMTTRVGSILLAAGGSRRLGQPKQLLAYEGRTLLRRAAEATCNSACRPNIVVLGAEYERCSDELAGLPVTTVLNPQWSEGMAGSIRTGLDSLIEHAPQTEAAVLCLCDQPYLTYTVLDVLIATYLATAKPIIASEYDGALGAPALFATSFFADLRAFRGDEGARRIFKRAPDKVAIVPFPGGEHDVDTPDDYRYLTSTRIRHA